MYEVVRFVPFHCTTELVVNPVPYTYMLELVVLITKLDGLVLVITGVAVGVATVNEAAGDVLEDGAEFTAVIVSLPVEVASVASSTNVNCVGLT